VAIKFVFPYPLNLSSLRIRFGNTSVSSIRRQPPIAYVNAPRVEAARVQVFASYDGVVWSRSNVFFEYEALSAGGAGFWGCLIIAEIGALVILIVPYIIAWSRFPRHVSYKRAWHLPLPWPMQMSRFGLSWRDSSDKA
jgi:hypothetical protein